MIVHHYTYVNSGMYTMECMYSPEDVKPHTSLAIYPTRTGDRTYI